MICSECGIRIPNDSLFCPECGTKQESELTQAKMTESVQTIHTNNGTTKECYNCRCQIPSDSRFCPECRARQEDVPPPSFPNYSKKQYSSQSMAKILTPEEQAKLKKRNKIIGIVFAVGIAACLIIGILSSFIKPAINLNEYLIVSFEGYNTIGKAKVSFDTEKFKADYEKRLSIATKKITGGMYIPSFALDDNLSASKFFLSTCVDGSLDVNEGLRNGDTVTYTWKCNDESALSIFGYKLKYEDAKFTVKGLKEVETFDPFEGIDVVFEGISPNGSANISGTPVAEAAQELKYSLDKYSGLSNGDNVTLSISTYFKDVVEYCIENYQMIPSPLTKTYTVEGLDSYVSSTGDISEESLNSMKSQAENVFNRNWGEGESLLNFTYLGNYLLTAKTDNSWFPNNTIYLVYKAQVKNEYSNYGMTYSETNDIYWYIGFNNLLMNPSGATTVDLNRYETPSHRFFIDSGISEGWWSTKGWYYYGYQSLDELYNAVVTRVSDLYNCEDNVDKSLGVNEVAEPNE